MSEASAIRLLSTENGQPVATPEIRNNEIIFKDGIEWVWVLDARIAPYTELPVEEVIARAKTNRKRYVLLNAED